MLKLIFSHIEDDNYNQDTLQEYKRLLLGHSHFQRQIRLQQHAAGLHQPLADRPVGNLPEIPPSVCFRWARFSCRCL